MTPPFYDKGRIFKFENELDNVLFSFVKALDLFDGALANRSRLLKLRATPEFRKAYYELGYPEYWENYKPSTGTVRLIDPAETKKLYKSLRKAVGTGDTRTWRKYRRQFVVNVLAEFRSASDWIGFALHGQSIYKLMETVQASGEPLTRQDALVKLVELDATFLTLPGAVEVVRKADIEANADFKTSLARALDPARESRAYESQRQRYVLFILSAAGYEGKSYSKWAEFFKYFNSQLGHQSGRAWHSGFTTFENPENIRKAIQQYHVPKSRAKSGRKKKL